MKPKAINQAIAEACEWAPEGCRCPHCRAHIPDYCNDLNAMHEAEKSAGVHLGQSYAKNLREVINQDERGNILRHETWVYYTATAAQRAEAFLKTLNLWK